MLSLAISLALTRARGFSSVASVVRSRGAPRSERAPARSAATRATVAQRSSVARRAAATDESFDAVVVGSGIGGLSCAAVLADAGKRVLVCEAHDHPGGCAHEYEVQGFRFENGPSLYAGLSPDASPNPLKHVFQIIGEEPEWLTRDGRVASAALATSLERG